MFSDLPELIRKERTVSIMKKIVALICVMCALSCVVCSAYADKLYGTPDIVGGGGGANNTYYITVRMAAKPGYYAHAFCDISGTYITNGMTTTYTAYGHGANASYKKGVSVDCTARCYPQLPDDFRTGYSTVSFSGYWQN